MPSDFSAKGFMETKSLLDRAAVALSFLCILHCLALPVAAVSLPFFLVVSHAEWVHWLFVGLAIIASGGVVYLSQSARVARFLLPVGMGVALLIFGLFSERINLDEAIPTVIGGLLIAYAHLQRIFGKPKAAINPSRTLAAHFFAGRGQSTGGIGRVLCALNQPQSR